MNTSEPRVGRWPVDAATTTQANRAWWDSDAEAYYREHGAYLGDAELLWCPEGWRESDLGLLGAPDVLRSAHVLEIGSGAAQGSRWVAGQGAHVIASDLSAGMLRQARAIAPDSAIPLIQCDARALPFADRSFDIVFSAYGVMPFVADPERVFRDVARVLRPGGRFVFSTSHPFRWAFPDDPGPAGLTVQNSYFDRTPYVERDDSGAVSYVEHHRTIGDWVRLLSSSPLRLVDLLEPQWPEGNEDIWGGWSPLRGRLIPGTAIFIAQADGE